MFPDKYILSVIIPVYNAEAYLDVCLSYFDKIDKNKIEILVMDGGSSDNTLAIAEKYKSRIKLHSAPDLGIYDAMNKGIIKAQGRWLYFLGVDDKFLMSESISETLENNEDCDLLYGNVERDGELYDGEFDLQKLVSKNICHQAIFFKKQIFDLIGLYSLKYNLLGDYEFNIKAFSNTQLSKRYVNTTVAIYNTQGASSTKIDEKFIFDLPRLFKKYCKSKVDLKPAYNYMSKIGLQKIYDGKRIKGLLIVIKGRFNGADKKFLKNGVAKIIGRG